MKNKKVIISIVAVVLAIAIGTGVYFIVSTKDKDVEGGVVTEEKGETSWVGNPVSTITENEARRILGLDTINLGDEVVVEEILSINSEIVSLNVTVDGNPYNIRVCKAKDDEKDISGVYLSENAESAIYDSADIDAAPSINADKDDSYARAYCDEWNGYYFSVSTFEKTDLDSIANLCRTCAQALLSK